MASPLYNLVSRSHAWYSAILSSELVATGVALGLVGALALGAAARSLLFNTEPTDPLTLAAVAALMLLSAVVACWIPARRATRVDPVEVLRVD